MGADGLAAVGNLGHDEVDALAAFDLVEQAMMGADSYQVLERCRERHGT